MNVEKNRHSRVRGWFPQEPRMLSTQFKVKTGGKTTQPPWFIPQGVNLSATKVTGGFAILWAALMLFCSITTDSFGNNSFVLAFEVLWIIGGLAIGVITQTIVTRNQLNRLSVEYKLSQNKKEWTLLIVPMAIFFSLRFLYCFWLETSQLWLLASILAWGIPSMVTKCALFYAYEKKENMRLVQDWDGTTFLIPKPPSNNINLSKTATEQGIEG